MPKKVYVATVQLVIQDVENDEEANEVIGSMLTEKGPQELLDWSYLRIGGQHMLPALTYVSDDYQEGDFLK
jgi:hypothetical protein